MRKKDFFRLLHGAFIGVVAVVGCGYSLTQSLPPGPEEAKAIKTVAVVPFGNFTSAEGAGSVVGAMVAKALAETGRYKVITSKTVEKALKDSYRGEYVLARDQAQKIGKAFKADAIVYGTVSEYWYLPERAYQPAPEREPAIGVNARVVDVKDGMVVAAVSISRTGGVFDSPFSSSEKKMRKLTRRVSREIVDQLFPGR